MRVAVGKGLIRGFRADPDIAVGICLFFPDRRAFFEAINRVLARRERIVPVRGRDGNNDAHFAGHEMTDAMMNRDLQDIPPLAHFRRDLGKDRRATRRVCFIVEPADGTAPRVIPHTPAGISPIEGRAFGRDPRAISRMGDTGGGLGRTGCGISCRIVALARNQTGRFRV